MYEGPSNDPPRRKEQERQDQPGDDRGGETCVKRVTTRTIPSQSLTAGT